jgi:hypothetical protein
MIIRSNFVDRRKCVRFKAKKGTLAEFYKPRIFKLGRPGIVKSAQIFDLCLDGLSFQYIDQNMWTSDFNELSISKGAYKIKIDKVPFKAIWDFSMSRLPSSLFKRRCGVKFDKLTPKQKHQLHYFIMTHTVDHQAVDRRSGLERRELETFIYSDHEKRYGIERRRKWL